MLKPMVLEEGGRTPPYSWEERSCDIIKVDMAMTKRSKIKILNDSIIGIISSLREESLMVVMSDKT